MKGGGVWQFLKSGRKEGSKKHAFCRGGGGVDFFWNNPVSVRDTNFFGHSRQWAK